MGLYQSLTGSASTQSSDSSSGTSSESGFTTAKGAVWVFSLTTEGKLADAPTKYPGTFPHLIPTVPRDRTSGSLSARLFADKAKYALGLGGADKELSDFLRVLQLAKNASVGITRETISAVIDFVDGQLFSISIPSNLKESDVVVFQVESNPFALTDPDLRSWWRAYLGERTAGGSAKMECCCCGKLCVPPRIMTSSISMFGYNPPLSSSNTGKKKPNSRPVTSDSSHGKWQMENAPVCNDCGAFATARLRSFETLDIDSNSGRNAVVIQREGESSRALSNYLAVFWTARPVVAENQIAVENVIRLSLDDPAINTEIEDEQVFPQANSAHLKVLLESPWHCKGEEVTAVNPVGFYFAILSPNKSRLVIREWVETNVDEVKRRLIDYRQALSIINPQTHEMIVPPLRAILQSLRSPSSNKRSHEEKPRLAEIEPELLRQIIRCMYQGSDPPSALLTRAVQAFRIPVAAADEFRAFDRLCARRTTLAAAIKLVLTYRNKTDQIAMEQLVTEHDANCSYKGKVPYLCGRLLALLNEIQYRASSSRRGVNTTLVDKYYAAASTAPNTVFGSMLKLANTAHLPKIRKDPQRNYAVKLENEKDPIRLSDLLNEVAGKIDSAERSDVAAAFPKQLNPQQQAEFALGYHHQQAILNPMSR